MFLHKQIPTNIFEGKEVLDIGCGRNKLEGSIVLDRSAYDGVDIVANLEGTLPIPDADFDMALGNPIRFEN